MKQLGFVLSSLISGPSLISSLTQCSLGESHGGPKVTHATHSVGYHFSQSSLGLIEAEDEEELDDELDDELDEEDKALPVVTELIDEFKGSSTSSVFSSDEDFPLRL